MDSREYITIRIEKYDEMVSQYWDAMDRIFDLELEIFELQEKLSLLTEEAER